MIGCVISSQMSINALMQASREGGWSMANIYWCQYLSRHRWRRVEYGKYLLMQHTRGEINRLCDLVTEALHIMLIHSIPFYSTLVLSFQHHPAGFVSLWFWCFRSFNHEHSLFDASQQIMTKISICNFIAMLVKTVISQQQKPSPIQYLGHRSWTEQKDKIPNSRYFLKCK